MKSKIQEKEDGIMWNNDILNFPGFYWGQND